MLLSECDLNRYPDPNEKSITTTQSSTSVTSAVTAAATAASATTMATDTRPSITTEMSQSPLNTQSQSRIVNNCNEDYNGHNIDTFDDDDDDDNRIG